MKSRVDILIDRAKESARVNLPMTIFSEDITTLLSMASSQPAVPSVVRQKLEQAAACYCANPSHEKYRQLVVDALQLLDSAPVVGGVAEGYAETVSLLKKHWNDFCDADPVPEDFRERMESAGLIELVEVTEEALEESFASERGIEKDGMMWALTKAGEVALAAITKTTEAAK